MRQLVVRHDKVYSVIIMREDMYTWEQEHMSAAMEHLSLCSVDFHVL